MSVPATLLLILVSVIGSAFYSGMETGVVAVNRLRLRHLVRNRVPGAAQLQAFLQEPDHLLGTTLVGTNLFNAIASVAAVGLGAHLLGKTGYGVAQVVITIVLLVFGEFLPKAWFQGRPAARTLPFIRFLAWNGYVFYPLSRLATGLARIFVPVRPPATAEDQPPLLAAESMLYRIVRGPLSVADVREMRQTIVRLDLPQRLDAISGRRPGAASL